MGPETPHTVTRFELLDFRERHWRKRIDVVSLAAEALDSITVSHREQTLEALGHLYQRQTGPIARAKLLRRWPAVHVLATCGVAADHYEAGTFWPKLTSLLGVQGDQSFNREWGEGFLDNLRCLGLPSFDAGDEDAGSRYVGRILMHSGMPTYCLRDFFRIIGERRGKVRVLGPEEFVSWASARAAQKQLYNVDKPVARFLQYGGDFAVDVTDRAFDLLDAVASGGDGSDVPLPDRFKEVAVQLREDGAIFPAGPRTSRSGRGEADQQPRVVVDPFGQGLILRLPAVGDAPDGSAVWLVALDGVGQRVATRALLPGLNEPAPQTDVPIPSPVRTASAALVGREDLQATLTVVDDKDPFLAFGEDGVLLPPGLPLPGRPTWLLFPGEPNALQVTGAAPVLSESPLPPGWSGWCLLLIDLEGASDVAVDAGRAHAIRNQASARVVADEPVRGVRTSTDLPVVPTVPKIQLPEELDEAKWDVALLSGAGDVIAKWRSGDSGEDPNAVWDAVSSPVVGTFTVRVRGPWGRGATRTLTVIEELAVVFNPPWRRFVEGGLQPCAARLAVPDGVYAARSTIEYAEQDRETYVRVGAHGDYRTLVVSPPHMTIAYQSLETTFNPSVKPLRLYREDITEDPGTLILDVGAAADPKLYFVSSPGAVQVMEPGAGRAGIYRFGLAKIVDTLAAYPQAQLALGENGDLVVATIRPRKLFSEVSLGDGTLEFSECVDVEGLTALVYATRAPWREPVSLLVVAGQAILPDWLVGAGPLRVLVRIEDPWAPLPVPEWPEAHKSKLVESDGYVTDEDDEAAAVSAFLAGVGELPNAVADLARLWTVRGLLGGISLGSRIPEVAGAVDGVVHGDPRAALLALTASRAPSEALPSLIIRAGLAWANLEEAHNDTPPSWSPRSALPSALLSAADADWSADEVEAAIGVCGDVVPELLSGTDPCASHGRLGASADVFDQVPAMREDFVRQTGLVPAGLLSGDSRRLAAMEFVKDRRDPRLEWLTRNAHRILDDTERMLRILAEPVAQTAFTARRHPTATGGWRVVPAISLGLALAARHAARGNQTAAGWLPRQSRIWADLAAVVPQMVTIDLIVAELLVASSAAKAQEHHA